MATVVLSNSIINANLDKIFDLSIWDKLNSRQYDLTSSGSITQPTISGKTATLKNPAFSGIDGSVTQTGSLKLTFDARGNLVNYSGSLSNQIISRGDGTIKLFGIDAIVSFNSPIVNTKATYSKISYIGINGIKSEVSGSINNETISNISTQVSSANIKGTIRTFKIEDDSGNSLQIKGSLQYQTSYTNLSLDEARNVFKQSPLELSGLISAVSLTVNKNTLTFNKLAINYLNFPQNINSIEDALPILLTGNDVISISTKEPTLDNYAINGYAGNDAITGGNNNDIIIGGVGNDTLVGGMGADSFVLSGSDTVKDYSSVQSDTVDVSGLIVGDMVTFTTASGNLDLSASSSAAAFKATAAATGATITGGAGADSLTGAAGADSLVGGAGSDTLTGAAGSDVINGGVGTDKLTGGVGKDTFVFAAGDSGQTALTLDVITDFAKGKLNVGDLIDYSSSLALGGSDSTATDAQASINQVTGIATFKAGSGVTLADALSDIATRFSASTDSAGELAFFKVNNAGNYCAFISDGIDGVTSGDVVIQLTGISSIKTIDLTGGNLAVLS